MHERLGPRFVRAARDSLLPRRTLRLRLTALYGGLFLISGVALLAITYLLMANATDSPLQGTEPKVVERLPSGRPQEPEQTLPGQPFNPTDGEKRAQASELETQLRNQRAADRHQFLIQSGISLAAMSVFSMGLGWIVAGRLLRHLRTITTTTRAISATNLHKRLALDGPDDELKQLSDTIDGLLERLEASFQSHRQFVANASHELRTPLARQRVVGQVALSDPDATVESLRAGYERMLAAGRQQERLIEALLTLARSEAGLERREPVDLALVAEPIVIGRRAMAEEQGLRLEMSLERAPVMGDRRLLEQLVTNLVDNALSHNRRAGWVEISTRHASGTSTLSVINTGAAIPEQDIGRLFEPFQRLGVERTGQDGGLGLGLSIVKSIAAAHAATIVATPRPAGGLELTVTFGEVAASRG